MARSFVPHLHILVLDGAHVTRDGVVREFVAIPAPSTEQVAEVVKTIRQRVLRLLVRRGIVDEQGRLATEDDEGDEESVLPLLAAASVQGVSAVGPEAGRRLTRPGRSRAEPYAEAELGPRCVAIGGFSLHANVAVHGRDRKGLEHMCRYMARPPVARERLKLLPDGRVYYAFKRVWRDGSRGVVMSGEDFIGKVAALIPRPQVNLVRYHGSLAPGSKIRKTVVRDRRPTQRPEKKEAVGETAKVMNAAVESAAGNGVVIRDRNYGWQELMKRVFNLDVLVCPGCAGRMKVIAEIDDPIIARKILEHLGLPADELELAPARGPPEDGEGGAGRAHPRAVLAAQASSNRRRMAAALRGSPICPSSARKRRLVSGDKSSSGRARKRRPRRRDT